MCDDWYRSPFDGACFGVLEASRLRSMTTPRYTGTPELIVKRRRGKVHWQHNNKTVCGISGRMSLDLDSVTCKRCLRGFIKPF